MGIGIVLAIVLTGIGGIILAVLGAAYFLYNLLTKDSFKNTKDKVKKSQKNHLSDYPNKKDCIVYFKKPHENNVKNFDCFEKTLKYDYIFISYGLGSPKNIYQLGNPLKKRP